MASIESSVRSQLGSDAALAALVGDRIYPGGPPDYEAPLPWIAYQIAEREPHPKQLSLTPDESAELHLDILAEDYIQAQSVQLLVRGLLNGYRGGNVKRMLWEGASSAPIEGGYLFEERYKVWGTTAAIVATASNLPRVEVRADGLYFGGLLIGPKTAGTVTGSRGGNAALTSLLTTLSAIGIIVDSTTA